MDWTVILLYAIGMLAIGLYYHLRMKDAEDYLLGGRNMPSRSVGLSLFATLFSTITYLALPGEIIDKGPVILWSMVSIPIAYVVVGYLLIPKFMQLRVTSAYEILESRLGLSVRLMGSTIFLVTRMLWMALIIEITAEKIIVAMLELDSSWTPWVAAGIGVITVIYTSMGGLRAVVLTDVIQTFILFAGALLAIILVTVHMGGVGEWWPRQWSPNWDSQPFFSLDPKQRVTVVGSIVYMTVWWIATAGSDQMAIQRYLATRDVKTARRVFLITGVSNICVTFLLAALGFALLGFFTRNPQYLAAGMDLNTQKTADIVFPYFIIRFIPPGITGLVLAGLLAAAMSSLSSGVNSSCSVIASDFVNRFRSQPPAPGSRQEMRETRLVSWITGGVAVLLSMLIGFITQGQNIMEQTVRTNHVFVGPLFCLFFMALFVRYATPIGTAVGAIAGCVVGALLAFSTAIFGTQAISFQWISVVTVVVNLAIAIPLSYVTYRGGRSNLADEQM
ncbi:MAG TPA: sodium/solute symporter [Phycisphaerae bacterium]|nr:sodium/solute symporter [Phycisphaerae bacterium]HOM52350.1 sodium/solute symporter [Phycisphaerae bacterium]HOQ86703.1 sodium/solute symporter [Phycisphaerae bacterium]HPP27477.1 sodium/solute symporter [Phycisphaerae bacterium]HPU26059.1 sodium/solute symporter [Phycisphaerae bacterium]